MKKVEKRGDRYRIRVTYYINGKQHYKSITADSARECRAAAAAFERSVADAAKTDKTVRGAVLLYIESMGGAYSPTTIRADRKSLRLYIDTDRIAGIPLVLVTQMDLQAWVSRLAERGLSRKTIKNAYSLISRTLDANGLYRSFRIKFPPQQPFRPHTPTVSELQTLLDYLYVTDRPLYIAAAISASTTLRRGEICALTAEDITGRGIVVDKSMKREAKGQGWVIAYTKTESSNRTAYTLPDWIRESLPQEGRIVPYNPDQLTMKFNRAVAAAGIPHIRFHDLRAFAASYMIAMGVSAVTVKKAGGWSDMQTPNRYYLRSIEEVENAQMESAKEAFTQLLPPR